jgi:hypothetical protein
MRRRSKNNTGLYAFLDASGVLEHGTAEAIEQAKKQYWREYKRKWKKERKKTMKTFEIDFDLHDLKTIIQASKKQHVSPTRYIKKSALANQRIVNPVSIGIIRELVIVHHNTILELIEEQKLSKPISSELLTQASRLEDAILDFFGT